MKLLQLTKIKVTVMALGVLAVFTIAAFVQKPKHLKPPVWFGDPSPYEGIVEFYEPVLYSLSPRQTKLILSCRKADGYLDPDLVSKAVKDLDPGLAGYLRAFLDYQEGKLPSKVKTLLGGSRSVITDFGYGYLDAAQGLLGTTYLKEYGPNGGMRISGAIDESTLGLKNEVSEFFYKAPRSRDVNVWALYASGDAGGLGVSLGRARAAALKFPHSDYIWDFYELAVFGDLETKYQYQGGKGVTEGVSGITQTEANRRAIKVCREFAKANPGDRHVYAMLGRILMANKDDSKALYCLEESRLSVNISPAGRAHLEDLIKKLESKGTRPQKVDLMALKN